MRVSKTALVTGAVIAAMAAATLAASSAGAETKTTTYVVCNKWDECWRVHEKYTTYPSDARIVWHDDAWRDRHEHDTHFHWLSDPADDHGWYDKDGSWRPFADAPAHP